MTPMDARPFAVEQLTVPRGIDAMAGSIKNEERFKDR